MRSPAQQERLAVEEQILNRELPQFRFHNHSGDTFVSGYQGANGTSRQYELKLQLGPEYPYEMPRLYVASPITLWKYRREGTVNEGGVSHSFHTQENGPDGCVQICHFGYWVSTNTCVAAILKGILWIQAYEHHLATGDDIAKFLR